MRCKGLLLWLALAACNRVFGLEPTHKEADAAIDSPIGCHTITPPLVSDTFLRMANPTTKYGANDALIVTDTDYALLKFFLGNMIEGGERIVDAKLTMQSLGNTGQTHTCAGPTDPYGCYYCMTGYVSWELHWMTSDWTELEASYTNARLGMPWSGAGATGATDRSPAVATGPSSTNNPITFEADSDATHRVDPTPYTVGGTFSIELVVNGGQATFDTKEAGGCGPAGPATLELTVCF